MCGLQLNDVKHNLLDEVISSPELECGEKSLAFLRDVNQFFETQDRDSNSNVKDNGRNCAGIGLSWIKEKADEG